MLTYKIFRLLHLIAYFFIAAQLTYYVYLMGDALKVVNINSFLEERKIVHPLVMQRHQWIYYCALTLSLIMVIWSIIQGTLLSKVTFLLAFLCLVTEVGIAIKGNGPLNSIVQQYSFTDNTRNWEMIREEWISYIKIRGLIIIAGLISLFVGLVFGRHL